MPDYHVRATLAELRSLVSQGFHPKMPDAGQDLERAIRERGFQVGNVTVPPRDDPHPTRWRVNFSCEAEDEDEVKRLFRLPLERRPSGGGDNA